MAYFLFGIFVAYCLNEFSEWLDKKMHRVLDKFNCPITVTSSRTEYEDLVKEFSRGAGKDTK